MLFNKLCNIYNKSLLLIQILILSRTFCQKLSLELLGGWSEKEIAGKTSDFETSLKIAEKYLESEGYSLDETDIIPFGFFKQTVNGINYRLLSAVKKKSDDTPTIYDIITHKSSNDFKMISSKNPAYSSTNLSETEIKKMKNAIYKYYFEKLYTINNLEIQYEYHNFDGLNKYAIYDIIVELNNEKEHINRRILIIYRNDKTYTVEKEIKAE